VRASARARWRGSLGNLEAAERKRWQTRHAVRFAGIELIAAAHRDDELAALATIRIRFVATEAAIASKRPGLAAKPLERAITSEHWEARAGAANIMIARSAAGRTTARAPARRRQGLAVRLAAARVLAHTGDRAGAAEIFAAALADPERAVQAAADLAALDDARGVHALSAAVRDPARNPEQRAVAAAAHRGGRHVRPARLRARRRERLVPSKPQPRSPRSPLRRAELDHQLGRGIALARAHPHDDVGHRCLRGRVEPDAMFLMGSAYAGHPVSLR